MTPQSRASVLQKLIKGRGGHPVNETLYPQVRTLCWILGMHLSVN